MSYPVQAATALIHQLDSIASANGGNAFVGELQPDAHGPDYRSVVVDITRQDWRRIYPKLLASGWTSYGEGGMVHNLPEGAFVVAMPSF